MLQRAVGRSMECSVFISTAGPKFHHRAGPSDSGNVVALRAGCSIEHGAEALGSVLDFEKIRPTSTKQLQFTRRNPAERKPEYWRRFLGSSDNSKYDSDQEERLGWHVLLHDDVSTHQVVTGSAGSGALEHVLTFLVRHKTHR